MFHRFPWVHDSKSFNGSIKVRTFSDIYFVSFICVTVYLFTIAQKFIFVCFQIQTIVKTLREHFY